MRYARRSIESVSFVLGFSKTISPLGDEGIPDVLKTSEISFKGNVVGKGRGVEIKLIKLRNMLTYC